MVGEQPDTVSEQILNVVTNYVRQSSLMDRALNDLEGSQFTLCLAARGTMPPSAFAIFLPDADAAMINLHAGEANAVAFGLHELRHGWQDVNGVFDRMPTDSRQDRFAMLYLIEADATAFSIAAAYQLRESGEPGAWHALARRHGYHEMTIAFEESLGDVTPGEPLTDQQLARGMRAAFNAFFDDTSFPADYTDFQRERWGHYPDRTTDKTAELRQLGQVIGQLSNPNGRTGGVTGGYIGAPEIAKARAFADRLVPMREPELQRGQEATRPLQFAQ